jgi:heme exporter protein A
MNEVRVNAVAKVFGRQRALGGVSFRLEAGRTCVLLGPNGAGKSTLVGILSTLVRPTSGEVLYDQVPHRDAARRLRGAIGLCAHESFLYGDLSGRENLLFYAGLFGVDRRRTLELLERVGLGDAADRPVRAYSRGMLQRLALARALVGDARLVLLDEPFTGLDRAGVASLRELIVELSKGGRLVLLVTHDLEAARGLARQVLMLSRGKIALDQASAQPFDDLARLQAGAP